MVEGAKDDAIRFTWSGVRNLSKRKRESPQSAIQSVGAFAIEVIEIEEEAIYNTRAHTDKAYSNRSCGRGDRPCWRWRNASITRVND
jgi:hypothetical protein